ncbi:MAG: hypothetical protein IPI75_00040 [Gammaproteobacteria bacterium]|nr:hypothetical protein [Gammaproteobacteria bacterium]
MRVWFGQARADGWPCSKKPSGGTDVKGVLQSLLLTVASVVLTLALAELLLHMFPSLLPLAISTAANDRGIAHPLIGNVKAPGSSGVIRTSDFSQPYQLDELGFHNKGPLPSQADIVVIGDSLVFGYGVDIDQAWPQTLARLSGKTVVNLGLIGASPQQYLRIYQTFGRAFKPKIVVVGFLPAMTSGTRSNSSIGSARAWAGITSSGAITGDRKRPTWSICGGASSMRQRSICTWCNCWGWVSKR